MNSYNHYAQFNHLAMKRKAKRQATTTEIKRQATLGLTVFAVAFLIGFALPAFCLAIGRLINFI